MNKLSLKTQKTKMMVFQKHIKELNIAIHGTKIDRVESFINILGITIDENLSGNHHVDIAKKKYPK